MNDLVLDPVILDRFQRMGAAIAIGLLIGVERGWKDRSDPDGSRTAGVRTFALIGLLGGGAALIAEQLGVLMLAVGFLSFAVVFGAFELQRLHRLNQSDATPTVAALVVFVLAALAGLGHFHIAAAAAVAAGLVLAFKDKVHGWLEKLTFDELAAGLVLAAMTVIVLPLLPDTPVDPWDAVSLREVWILTVLIAAISFVGYGATRIFGMERGPLVAGAAGGMVSSTATVLSMARMARKRRRGAPPLIAGAIAANAVMFARVAVLVAALRIELAAPIAASLVPATLVTIGFALWLARRPMPADGGDSNGGEPAKLEVENPLNLKTAATFAVLLAVISVAAAALEEMFGARGVIVLAAVSGLADVDAITLSMTQGSLPAEVATLAILIAVGVNTASKAALARVAGGPRVGLWLLVSSAAALAAAAAGYLGYAYLTIE